MAAIPKPAATIMLLRDYRGELQVFLQQRAYEASFVGGAFVFPGGKVDEADKEVPEELLVLPEGQHYESLFSLAGAKVSAIAAIRECFEESGILLAYDSEYRVVPMDNEQARIHWSRQRDRLNRDDIDIAQLCREQSLKLALDQLVLVGHWVTPGASPQRFDTLFYACIAPVFQEGDHDDFESIHSVWWSASQALEQYHKGKVELIFPTLKSIEHLSRFEEAQDFIEHHAKGLSVLGRD